MIQWKSVLLLVLCTWGYSSAQAQVSAKPCIAGADVAIISKTFAQFSKTDTGKSVYCESDLGADVYPVVSALVALKNIKPNEPTTNSDDSFTHKAITESDWWAYFIKRAQAFTVEEKCQESVVAFVIPFFKDGNVHLCPLFFESSLTSQASVLMHEVRHFDGFSHVMCMRGLDAGSSGACDNNILDKGSYSISVQTLVGLARSSQVPKEEKPMVEAEAIFTAYNRFNVIPKVRVNESIILSDTTGAVYNWKLDEGFSLVGLLAQPARVYVGFENLTIYPLDTAVNAYRFDMKLTVRPPSIGLFANRYNSETPEERKKYDAITYLGTGGLLKNGNSIATNCGGETILDKDLSAFGSFAKLISLSNEGLDADRVTYAVNSKGELLTVNCTKGKTDSLDIAPTPLKLSVAVSEVEDIFALGGQIFGLLKTGTLVEMAFNGNDLGVITTQFPFDNKNWVSASPTSKPEVF